MARDFLANSVTLQGETLNHFRHSYENRFKICTKTEGNAKAIATCLTYAFLQSIYIGHWLLMGSRFPASRSHLV